ncbi:PIN-like domain-containing protein [Bacillus velezensis]|uniref:PIN-like domain-containing protein n=1 Tax=Bacillus velezensis TaxID=492670 RepID=UPI003C2B065F
MDYAYNLEDFKTFWSQSPIVVFDTNAILHLYRMSSTTTEDILKTLKNIPQEQIWLPHQVVVEYNRNKENSRASEFSKYKKLQKEIKGIIEQTKSKVSSKLDYYVKLDFPEIEDLRDNTLELLNKINITVEKYNSKIKDEVDLNSKILKEDKIDQFVKELIQSRCVGSCYSILELIDIYNEGESRYKYKIPPGYEDIEKDKTDPTKTHKFGDLLIWKQLIDKAILDNKPVIFVTNDDKEDWWLIENGTYIKPREELYEEFNVNTSQDIEIMNLTNFYTVFAKAHKMFSKRAAIEMKGKEICSEIITNMEWYSIIDKDGELTSSLIHDGVLQTHVDNLLSNVDVHDYGFPELNYLIYLNFDDEDHVRVEFEFDSLLITSITEEYSSSYGETNDFAIKINGKIAFEFAFQINENDDLFLTSDSENAYIEHWEIANVEKIFSEGTEICFVCNKNESIYYTAAREGVCKFCSTGFVPCPKCGNLYRRGELHGNFCYNCEME